MADIYNYILIDGALWEEDIELARQFGVPNASLFRGKPAEELNAVAPYLFRMDDDEFETWVNERERKEPIARRTVRLSSGLDMDDLRRHLRRFLRVQKESGGFLYYRYYDPKVVACTFPCLTEEQLREFFSEINAVWHFSDVLLEKRTYTYVKGKCVVTVEADW